MKFLPSKNVIIKEVALTLVSAAATAGMLYAGSKFIAWYKRQAEKK